jgi:hypothetical protein
MELYWWIIKFTGIKHDETSVFQVMTQSNHKKSCNLQLFFVILCLQSLLPTSTRATSREASAAKSTTESPPPPPNPPPEDPPPKPPRHFLGCLELGYPVNLVHDHHGFLNFRHRLCFRNKDKDDHDNNNEW